MEVADFLSRVGESTTRLFRHSKPDLLVEPQLQAVRKYSYGPFVFKCQAPAELDYAIQATSDFKSWEAVQTGRATGEWFEVVDSAAPEFPRRFYRITVSGVRSATLIGFLSVSLPPGYAMIANPLVGPSDRIGRLLPQMPEGTKLSRFDTLRYRFAENRVSSGRWLLPEERLEPGTGAVLFNPTSESMTRCFTGQVITGRQFTCLHAGFSIRSSLLPLPGRLDTELGFPVAPGDAVHVFGRTAQSYTIHEYGTTGWQPAPPIIGAGESFWVAKQAPANWAQELTLAHPSPAG
jgi:hypothetical protein